MARLLATFRRRQSRPLRTTLIAVAIVFPAAVFLWIGFVSVKVLFPTPGSERHADVIISLAPGEHRLPKALELYGTGVADQLAVSWYPAIIDEAKEAGHSWAPLENETCRDEADPLIHCFTPVLDSTFGEALTVRELAEQHNWNTITVVTSRYHAFRTKFIFERHLPRGTDLEVIAAPTDLAWSDWMHHVIYENAAIVKAIFESARR